MLSINFILFNRVKKSILLLDNSQPVDKLHRAGSFFYKPCKYSNCVLLRENKFKILFNEIFGLILQTENGGCSSVG
jgi:hypothetical protein